MNRIEVKNDEITLVESDELIEVTLSDKFEIFDVRKMNIKVMDSTKIEIIYESSTEAKIDIEYNICSNVNLEVIEIRKENKTKVQYKYYIDENSNVDILKFYDCNTVRELDIVNLNGFNSKINYILKTIVTDTQKYDLVIYHNNKNTISNIKNNSVNMGEGTTNFNVTSVVYNGITGCTLNQMNKIINLNDKECKINPNLLIEENDVTANHSALIGKFSDEEIFYLMRLGIDKETSIKLLTRGFLLEEIDNKEITDIVDKYWR